MINRRTLLSGTAGLALSSLLTGCGATANALRVTLLEGSVPAEVLKRFRQQAESPVDFQMITQLETVFQQLQRWQLPPKAPTFSLRRLPWAQGAPRPAASNLVSLGDYWLAEAIAQDLIEPLDLPTETLEKLPVAWQQFVSREARSGSDQIAANALWAAPYKVQTLVIAYRPDQFPQAGSRSPFKTWRDLLQPQLRRQLALPDHPRIVLGLLQKMQSGSFNPSFEMPADSASAAQLTDSLIEPFTQLNQQVRTYDSDTSLKALVNQDVAAVVGWSGDVMAALQQYRELKVVIPAEGSLLSADMWVRPKGADMSAAAKKWIAFCWQTGPATQISIAGKGLSPIFLDRGVSLPGALEDSPLSITAIQNSEPLLPLPAAVQTAYLNLWQQVRTG
ncbi:MAG: extracellular solute-binding protein [Phormidesmis sp.]